MTNLGTGRLLVGSRPTHLFLNILDVRNMEEEVIDLEHAEQLRRISDEMRILLICENPNELPWVVRLAMLGDNVEVRYLNPVHYKFNTEIVITDHGLYYMREGRQVQVFEDPELAEDVSTMFSGLWKKARVCEISV